MSRWPRVEYPGALYHVRVEGRFHDAVFPTDRERLFVEELLVAAARRTGWRIHAFSVLPDRYEAAIETPRPNLVVGMRWIQAALANKLLPGRPPGLRRQIFQRRYEARPVESHSLLGPIIQEIILAPVRAGLCSIEDLSTRTGHCLRHLDRSRRRDSAFEFRIGLKDAGHLADHPDDHRRYLRYLAWLARPFDQGSHPTAVTDPGPVVGSRDFRRRVLTTGRSAVRTRRRPGPGEKIPAERDWEEAARRALGKLGRRDIELPLARKSAPWKLAAAVYVRDQTTATVRWIARRFYLGHPDALSRMLGEVERGARSAARDCFETLNG